MTREEAIKWLNIELKEWENDCLSKHPIKEALSVAIEALEQESNTWNLDDAREDFMSDVYNTLDLPTNNEANRIIDSFDRVTSGIKQEPILDKVRAEIEEAALDDANGSKFIFVNRVNQIIDKYKTESEEETADGKRLYVGVNWQYCKNLNDINDAIANHDEDWEGLNDANDIISITYDSNHSSYVVFWKHCTESE